MADRLSRESIDRLYSSPLARARETAAPLARRLNLEVEIHPGVAEYDRDADAYLPMERLKELDYERWLRLMQGEIDIDFETFSRQVIDALEQIVADNPRKRVAVTCHGGVINIWTAHVIGMPPRFFFYPDYTSIHRYLCAGTGQKTVRVLNEAVHLGEWVQAGQRGGGVTRPR
jgi:probable phosphoglycerate mutase